MIKAAGIIYIANGRVLLVKRTAVGDHAGEWCVPGGKIEASETPQQAAIRESTEEVGYTPDSSAVRFLAFNRQDDVDFSTFLVRCEEFVPVLNEEHSDAVWAELEQPPQPLHPGLARVLTALPGVIGKPGSMTELEVAQGIVAGTMPSPSKYENVSLVAIRITGTGTAYRSRIKEYVYRRPENYMTDEFLARCNGLPVVWEHPEGAKLNTEEFVNRIVGTVLLPYLKKEAGEVWGIAKIYDEQVAEELSKEQLSTSPGVFFRDTTVNEVVPLSGGDTLLIEGVPSLLDHIAICRVGVWDKGGAPSGIVSETRGDSVSMEEDDKIKADAEAKARADAEAKAKADAAEQARKDAEEKSSADLHGKLDKLLSGLDALGGQVGDCTARLDSLEGKGKSDAEKEEEAKAEKDKKDRKDAEEKEAKEKEEVAAKDKKDAEDRSRIDAELADLKSRMPKADDDEGMAEMADSQAKADSVMSAHGLRAPRPLAGETPVAYRRRLATSLKKHSKDWASVDLTPLSGDVLAIAEGRIYADAMLAANNPADVAEGTLRAVVKMDDTGRKITTFVGDPSVWMGQFRSPSRRLARPLFRTNRADGRG